MDQIEKGGVSKADIHTYPIHQQFAQQEGLAMCDELLEARTRTPPPLICDGLPEDGPPQLVLSDDDDDVIILIVDDAKMTQFTLITTDCQHHLKT